MFCSGFICPEHQCCDTRLKSSVPHDDRYYFLYMGPAQSLHNKASDTFARLVMSYSFYKAITSSEETPRDWNFTSLHHLYVLRYPPWQIAIPHPIRSDLALLPCFSFFEQKMILNKGRLGECKRSIIPSGSLSHKDPLCVSTLNTLHTKAKYR